MSLAILLASLLARFGFFYTAVIFQQDAGG